MFTCNGKYGGDPTTHSHEFAFQAKACYNVAGYQHTQPPAHAAAASPAVALLPPPFGSKANPLGPLSQPQYRYIGDLGGDKAQARHMTYADASEYIAKLITERAAKSMTNEPPKEQPRTHGGWGPPRDERLDMIEPLLRKVPKGYFAVGDNPERVNSLTFMRLSWPDKGQFKGACKIQQVIGTGDGTRLLDYAVWWPSGNWSVYRMNSTNAVYTNLMHLVADYAGAALLYSEHIGQCCRCNAQLTDERSRWYGIGPECEGYWPWIIEQVIDRKGVFK